MIQRRFHPSLGRYVPTVFAVALLACSSGGDNPGSESDSHAGGASHALGDTYDDRFNGAHIVLSYDEGTRTFTGTVSNTSDSLITKVFVGVMLSNGDELGPFVGDNVAPGGRIEVVLAATEGAFETWSVRRDVKGGEGIEDEDDHDHVWGSEYGRGDTHDLTIDGARLVLSYNAATNSFEGTLKNTTRSPMPKVFVGVKLSNGAEIGPFVGSAIQPEMKVDVRVVATEKNFDVWSARHEVARGHDGS